MDRKVVITPSTSANPTPTGNATANPAMSMAATSRMLDRLKITPPRKADPQPFAIGLLKVRQKAAPAGARAAHGEREHEGQQEHADGVIPIEQLETPFLAGEFLRIGPRSPAKHGDNAHDDGERIGFDDDHKLFGCFRSFVVG